MRKKFTQLFDAMAERLNQQNGQTVRMNGNEAQAPTVTYRHPATGRWVHLVGVMHIARPAFYAEVNRFIDDNHHCTVLYELVGGDPAKEGEFAPEEVAKAKEQFDPLKEMYALMAEATGCVMQFEALPIRKGWINTDMSSVQFFHELFGRPGPAPTPVRGGRSVPRVQNPLKKLMAEQLMAGLKRYVDQMKEPGMREEIRKGFDQNMRNFKYSNLLGHAMKLTGLQLPFIGLVLDRRNDIGVAGILEHVKKSDIISIWGAAHLPGMGEQLRKAGFEEVSREWRTVHVCADEK